MLAQLEIFTVVCVLAEGISFVFEDAEENQEAMRQILGILPLGRKEQNPPVTLKMSE